MPSQVERRSIPSPRSHHWCRLSASATYHPKHNHALAEGRNVRPQPGIRRNLAAEHLIGDVVHLNLRSLLLQLVGDAIGEDLRPPRP
jgi:hypothetical protein